MTIEKPGCAEICSMRLVHGTYGMHILLKEFAIFLTAGALETFEHNDEIVSCSHSTSLLKYRLCGGLLEVGV